MTLKRSFLESAVDYLFGYDFFISYCWEDGRQYALQLHEKLSNLGFSCFLDSSDYAKGDNWRNQGKRALKKTSRLVLVGTQKAIYSEPVNNELRIYTDLGRRIIPIDINGSLSDLDVDTGIAKYLNSEILRIAEPTIDENSGPSTHVVQELINSFNLIRQDKKRLRWVSGAACTLLALVIVTAFLGILAEDRKQQVEVQIERERKAREEAEKATILAKQQTLKAEEQTLIANQQTLKAEEQTRIANQQTLKAEEQTLIANQESVRAELRLSQTLISAGEFDRARQALSRITANSRNWIWGYLNHTAHPYYNRWDLACVPKDISSVNKNETVAICHDGNVWLLDTSTNHHSPRLLTKVLPDGVLVAKAEIDGGRNLAAFVLGDKAVLYDYIQEQTVFEWQLLTTPQSVFSNVRIHPTELKILVNLSGDGTFLYQVGYEEPVWSATYQPERNLNTVSFSPDGKYIATAKYPYIIIDAKDGKRIIALPGNIAPSQLTWTEHNHVVGAGPGGNVKMLSTETYSTDFWSSSGADFSAVSSFNDFILLGDEVGNAFLLEYSEDGKTVTLIKKMVGHDGSAQTVALNNEFAFVGDKSSVTAWKVNGINQELDLKFAGSVWDLDIDPSGELLAAGVHRTNQSSCIQIIDINKNVALIEEQYFEENICTDVDWNDRGSLLLAGAGEIYLTFSRDGSLVRRYQTDEFVQSVSFAQDGVTMLLGAGSKIGIVEKGSLSVEWSELGNHGSVRKIVPIKDTSTVVYITSLGYVGCFDWEIKQLSFSGKFFSSFGRALTTSDLGSFASGSYDGDIIIGQCDGQIDISKLPEYNGEVVSLSFIDNDAILQVGYHDGVIAFYSVETLELLLQSKPHNEHVRGAVWNQATEQLFTGDQSGEIVIWNTSP